MTGAVAVLRREIAERWLLFAGAAMLGLLPLAAPLLPGGYADMRGDMAVFLGRILSGLLALILGATVVSRDLAEGRLGFYFSRPLAGGALWTGKFAGATLLACVCGILSIVPGWLATGAPGSLFDLAGLFSWGLVVLSLLFLAHAAGVLLRERSAWLLLDFVAFCGVATLIETVRTNSYLSGTGVFERVFRPGLAFAVAVLATASAVQLLAGRSDLRRGRRLLSLWLWPPLLAGAAVLAVYSYRAARAEPHELLQAKAVVAAPTGSWIGAAGPVAGLPDYRPGILIDALSGRSVTLPVALGSGGYWSGPPVFSADGRRAAWAETRFQPYTVFSLDLDRPGAEPVLLPGAAEREFQPVLALSPDGRYLAQRAGGRLVVDDLVTRRLVATVSLPGSRGSEEIRFPGDRALRVFWKFSPEESGPEGGSLRIQDLDLATGRLKPSVTVPVPYPRAFLPSRDGRRLLVWSQDNAVRLHDGATGEGLAEVAPAVRGKRLAFLADGRVLAALPHPRGTELLVFPPDGSGEPRRHLLAGVRQMRFGGQPSPESLVVVPLRGQAAPRAERLDLQTGRGRPLAAGLTPISNRGQVPRPDSVASRLFLRDDTLVLLDFSTGREKVLTGEGAARP